MNQWINEDSSQIVKSEVRPEGLARCSLSHGLCAVSTDHILVKTDAAHNGVKQPIAQ